MAERSANMVRSNLGSQSGESGRCVWGGHGVWSLFHGSQGNKMTFIAVLLVAFLDPFTAQVVSVHDGDTITVRSTQTYKVRLYGIDAPELKQPYGQSAKHALSEMTFGKSVKITPTGKDRYGRIVAKIESDNVDVNRAMVEQGAAWWYTAYAKGSFDLQNAQSKAQAEKIGLWAEMQPIAPWEFRKGK